MGVIEWTFLREAKPFPLEGANLVETFVFSDYANQHLACEFFFGACAFRSSKNLLTTFEFVGFCVFRFVEFQLLAHCPGSKWKGFYPTENPTLDNTHQGRLASIT